MRRALAVGAGLAALLLVTMRLGEGAPGGGGVGRTATARRTASSLVRLQPAPRQPPCGVSCRAPKHEAPHPSTPAPGVRSPAPREPSPVLAWWSTPVAAVSAFARVYTNWSAGDLSERLRILAAASLGPARREMAAEATQTQNDPELQSGGLSNQGVLESVSPLPGQPERYIVITRERTVAARGSDLAGMPSSWHVTLAAVTALGPGRWVVSDWRPES